MSSESPKLDFSNIKAQGHKTGALDIHPYFGKLDPALAVHLITSLSQPGDIILDPFSGSGTVLHEALLIGRSVVGWDSSPLAKMLTTAKLSAIFPSEEAQIEGLIEQLSPYESSDNLFSQILPSDLEVPLMPRVRDIGFWFSNEAIKELAFIKKTLNQWESLFLPAAKLLAWTAFSKIIIKASRQEGESTYRRIEKKEYPGRVIGLYISAISDVLSSAAELRKLMEKTGKKNRTLSYDENISCLNWEILFGNLFIADSRNVQFRSDIQFPLADLVVSSPPYLMSWDYGLYHKFRFYWLGLNLDEYETTEIGRHLRRKKDDVERYKSDMIDVFRSVSLHLKPTGRIAFVNAPSVVYGQLVDTNLLLEECGRETGWKMSQRTPTISIPGPHHGMYASLDSRGASAPGQSGKQEHVLIFERE